MIKKLFGFFKPSYRPLSAWLVEYRKILLLRNLKNNTLTNKLGLLQVVESLIGTTSIRRISTYDLHQIINNYVLRGTNSAACRMYMLLIDIFREAIAAGWIDRDPALSLKKPKAPIKRSRLIISEFINIYDYAKQLKSRQYIHKCMLLALATGQRRADISKMMMSDVHDGYLFITQQKTNERIALPLDLVCPYFDVTLSDIIKYCGGGIYIVENSRGRQISVWSITKSFLMVRDATFSCDIWQKSPPTFHEIRSLSERLYRASGIDTMNLLGHKSQAMTDKYNDSRGKECRYLRI